MCDKTIDKVVGVVDSKELLKKYADGKPFVLKDSGLITPVIAVPDSLSLSETLQQFKSQTTDFAVVVNEYALTVGIITLKDILWIVMGDFVSVPDEQQIIERDDGSWLIDGATPVDDVERLLDIARMPEEESYETMAGFMMYMLRRIPKLTDRVNYAGWRFEVIDVEGARVDQVLATRLKDLEVSEKVREQVVKEQKQAVAKTQQLSTPPADQKDLAPKKEDK